MNEVNVDWNCEREAIESCGHKMKMLSGRCGLYRMRVDSSADSISCILVTMGKRNGGNEKSTSNRNAACIVELLLLLLLSGVGAVLMVVVHKQQALAAGAHRSNDGGCRDALLSAAPRQIVPPQDAQQPRLDL